jgi:hypothetical protein
MSTQASQDLETSLVNALRCALRPVIAELAGNAGIHGNTYLPDESMPQAGSGTNGFPSSRATQRDVNEPVTTPWAHIATCKENPAGYGKLLVENLAALPHPEQIQSVLNNVVQFNGVPETPAATRDPSDRALHAIQSKLEAIMNLQVSQFQGDDKEFRNMGTLIAALTLQCFHEVNEARRKQFVKGNTSVLQRNNTGPRLLSEDEEARLRQSRARSRSPNGFGRGNGNFGRGRSPFRGFRGKGFGRGGGGNRGRGGWRSRSYSPRRSPSRRNDDNMQH